MISIGLYNTKNPYNFGSICRLAGCYGVGSILIQGTRFKKSAADVGKYYRNFPIIHSDNLIDNKPVSLIPIAVEIDDRAHNIVNYQHFKNSYYVFGAEDHGIPQEILDRCVEIVRIPSKHCLNLATTVATVLYDRIMKKELFGFRSGKSSPREEKWRNELKGADDFAPRLY